MGQAAEARSLHHLRARLEAAACALPGWLQRAAATFATAGKITPPTTTCFFAFSFHFLWELESQRSEFPSNMPKVLSYTPEWLSRPSAGFKLFQSTQPDSKQQQQHEGPRKTIAHRGSEVFVAVGKELRWSDLSLLRDAEQDGRANELGQGYRVCYTKDLFDRHYFLIDNTSSCLNFPHHGTFPNYPSPPTGTSSPSSPPTHAMSVSSHLPPTYAAATTRKSASRPSR